jgi:ABC-type sugar transport system ATPase subunit
LLTVNGVTKRFPGTLALDDFNFDVEAGEIHALLGENGAGKSIFIKVLAGVHAPDGGEIRLGGAPLPPGRGAETGIAFIHQDLALADSMSVMENIGHVSVGMIFVTHRLDEVFRIADRVTVMRDGRRVITRRMREADRDAIVEAIIGRAPDQLFVRDIAHRPGSTVIEFDAVAAGAAGPCSFSVRAGEIVALVGLEGAGQTDMSRVLVGDALLTSGRIRFLRRPYEQPTAGRSIALGIGFVSAKRGVESVAAERTLRENLFINPSIPNRIVGRWINPRREHEDARSLMRRFASAVQVPRRLSRR